MASRNQSLRLSRDLRIGGRLQEEEDWRMGELRDDVE
jgi:hypothetical protein